MPFCAALAQSAPRHHLGRVPRHAPAAGAPRRGGSRSFVSRASRWRPSPSASPARGRTTAPRRCWCRRSSSKRRVVPGLAGSRRSAGGVRYRSCRRLPRARRDAVLARQGLESALVTGGGYKYLQLGEGNAFLRPPNGSTAPGVTGWFAEFGPRRTGRAGTAWSTHRAPAPSPARPTTPRATIARRASSTSSSSRPSRPSALRENYLRQTTLLAEALRRRGRRVRTTAGSSRSRSRTPRRSAAAWPPREC